MKHGIAFALSLLSFALAGLLAPSPARADVHDCINGCNVITCNDTVCTLWMCNETGCTAVARWHREEMYAVNGAVRPDGYPRVAHARVCPVDQPCRLFEMDGDQSVMLGEFPNIDDLVRERAEPAPRRDTRRR